MTLSDTLQKDIQQLPPDAQKQLMVFVDFLKFRYGKTSLVSSPIVEDASFGAIHVKKRVSLTQMEHAIAQQGSSL